MKMHNLHHLTGIRGLAAFIVVFYHIEAYIAPYLDSHILSIVQHGYLAVDFFFILSGFVIAFNYYDRLKVVNKSKVYNFYLKRVARIYPLHLLFILAYLSIPVAYTISGKILDPEEQKFAKEGFFFSLFLMQSWGGLDTLTWNIPSWSISTEMMAYLLFPLMVFILNFICKRFKSWGSCIALVMSCLLLICIFQGSASIGDYIQPLGVFRCVLEFFCGVCIWYLTKYKWKETHGRIIFYCGIFIFLFLMNTDIKDYYFVPLTMSLIILGSVLHKSKVNDLFSCAPLIWLGNISYSIYLSHYLIRDWFKLLFLETNEASVFWIVGYVITVLISSHFLYTYFEMAAKDKVLKVFINKGPGKPIPLSNK